MEKLTATSSQNHRPPLLGQMESLCDLTRLRLLWLIERQELGVAEICDVLQLPQSTVSRHLKLLSDQGWAASRRHGTANLYRMVGDELDEPARQLWDLACRQIAQMPSSKQDQLRLTQRLRMRRQEAQTFFVGAAGHWDKLRSELYGSGFTHAAMLALLPRDWRVADMGCGTGTMASKFSPYVNAVIGIDQSDAMLKAAAKRTDDLSNVELRRGDLESLPMESGEVDAAILSIVLTYVTDPEIVLREAARVIRAHGRVVVVDLLHHDREDFCRQMGQHWPGFEPAELEKMLADAGFDDTRCQPLPPEPQAQGPALVLAVGDRRAG